MTACTSESYRDMEYILWSDNTNDVTHLTSCCQALLLRNQFSLFVNDLSVFE